MDYVPKFLAAYIIGTNLEQYGFTRPVVEPLPEIAAINVPGSIPLDSIAAEMQVPRDALRQLNRHLISNATPSNVQSYRIWVPKEMEHQFADAESRLQKYVSRVAATTDHHTIRRGETLSSIAGRYGMTVAELRRLNNMQGNRIYTGRRLRVTGTAPTVTAAASAPAAPTTEPLYYQVRPGDNLYLIAQRHGTTVQQLQGLNNLSGTRINAGQRLRVEGGAQTQYHRVQRGENLTIIARRYGTTVNNLQRMNNLRGSRIQPGMRLQVGASSEAQFYRVRQGDNLYLIARRFGLTVPELKQINQLRRNTIFAGQVLTVSRTSG